MQNPFFVTFKNADGQVVAKDAPIWGVPTKGSKIDWRGSPIVRGTVTSEATWTATNGFTMIIEPDDPTS